MGIDTVYKFSTGCAATYHFVGTLDRIPTITCSKIHNIVPLKKHVDAMKRNEAQCKRKKCANVHEKG